MKSKKAGAWLLSAVMATSVFSSVGTVNVQAAGFSGQLETLDDVKVDGNIAYVSFNDGTVTGKITFLEDGIFRYNVDPSEEFSEYAAVRGGYPDSGKIPAQSDNSSRYSKPEAKVSSDDESFFITNGSTTIEFDKDTALMSVKAGDTTVMEEKVPLTFNGTSTVQTLVQHTSSSNTSSTVAEQFYGGGTQNGRLVHTGEVINISNEGSWTDGGVSSPSPFYYTTNGYGVLRNTWKDGSYDFGSTVEGTVTTKHNENEYDAYIFVSDAKDGSSVVQDLLTEYYTVTGDPVLLPQYAFYLGHLNAYNRDSWSTEKKGSGWTIKGNDPYTSSGTTTYEQGGTGYQITAGLQAETLNGKGPTVSTDNVPEGLTYPYEFSAQAVLNEYQQYDMPFGFFLPNDGYGAGYGQNGYNMTGGVNADGTSSEERLAAIAANVANLEEFVNYTEDHGVATGLWTQSDLEPDSNPNTYWHLLRDFKAEVAAGVSTLKTDVMWVGYGYSFQLSGVKQAYDIVTTTEQNDGSDNVRPNIISLDGWAGSQRYNSVWTGDQKGGDWEYIRFHIPTFIGQSLSGNPNIGSDMDGIWGGSPNIATRDYQWKSFAPQMLDMDGWGSYAKGPYVHGDPYTGISRMYLKIKAMMMPYTYTNAYAAANIDTGNGDQGLPMVRAMFLEYPDEEYAYTLAGSQYQYLWGEYLLVAPVYEDTNADEMGNDVRNGIYLPGGEDQIWIDYFTGTQYRGGQILNSYDAPLWKLPLFVKNGAIIPMYAEHNSALPGTDESVDRTIRQIEFWPSGNSDFTAFEDDGSYIENNITQETGYGDVENISYGDHVSTTYTSKVDDNTATLTANASTGSYDGYEKEKDTTFIVHASEEPTAVAAYNGNSELEKVVVNSKEEFDAATPDAGTFVYFYDTNPKIETFASDEEEILAEMVANVQVSPKLYVKFAKTDTQANEQKLVIEGYKNEGSLNSTELNENLGVPTLSEIEDEKLPDSITLTWDKVEGANGYELLVDGSIDEDGKITEGIINSVSGGDTVTFKHSGLNYHSEHSYYIRAVNEDGHSKWSEIFTTTSAEDPFLYTPEVTADMITWTGDIYGSHNPILAFDEVFQTGDAGFHSDTKAIGETLTVDYGKAYVLDYIEYYPRTDAGNGTVTKMRVETSLDGVNWVVHGQNESSTDANADLSYTMVRDSSMKTLDLRDPNTGASSIGARYVRFTPLQSVGNFFSASELKVYTVKDGAGTASKPFLVGNISTVGMSEPTLTTFQQMYQKESSQHGSYKNATWVGEVQSLYGDINFNGIADVWDYAFTAFNVNGGTSKTGSVSGDILLQPSAKTVKAGETFTVNVTALNVKNLNAYGSIINYDPAKVEYVSTAYIGTGAMYTQGMTGAIVNDDGTAYINHNALNMGDQELVSGSKILATITLKAKTDITLNDLTDTSSEDFVMDLSSATLIGPDFSVKESKVATDIEIPDVPTTTTVEYKQSDFNITMTNDVLTEDDGSNVSAIVQSGSYNGLFDGSYGRDFEFTWDTGATILPEGQKLPTTMHLNMKNPSPMSTIEVHNANRGNGYLTSMEYEVFYTDETSDKAQFNEESSVYKITVDDSKVVKSVDLTFLSSTGQANENNDPRDNRMLTLAEIDFFYTSGVPAESIEPAEGTATEMYVGYMENIQAVISPTNCPNQYFTVTSSNPGVASIVTLADKNGDPIYYVQGISEGTTTITLTAAADENVTYSYELTVKAGVEKDELVAAISETTGVEAELYTAASYEAYKTAYDAAVAVNNNPNATRADVEAATSNLLQAYAALTVEPVDSSLKLDVNIGEGQTVVSADAAYSESNTADKMFDNDLMTYWESPYGGSDANLPKDIILTLDGKYDLQQISFISHSSQNGGVTSYAISVSTNGKDWIEVATGTVDANKYKQGNNVRVDARFMPVEASYVKFTVLGAVGRIESENDMYGRIAEMELYGQKDTGKAALYELATEAQNMTNDGYTEESWTAFQDALQAAFTVYDDAAATEEEVTTAFNNLQAAITGLEKEEPVDPDQPEKVNKDDLYALLDQYDSYKAADYTTNSWAAFKAAYEAAKAVYLNENATQDDVDKAITALENAGKALVKVSGNGGNIETNPDNDYNSTEKPADTGSSMPVAPYAAATVVAAGALLLVLRRRRAAK